MALRKVAASIVAALAITLTVGGADAARDRTPPTTPTNLRITASSDTGISLAWNASTDNSSSFWYIVSGCGGTIRVNPPATTFSHSRLWPERTYTCFVYSLDQAGNRSGNSNTVSFTTPPDITPPTAPTLTATAVTPTRVALAWTDSTDNVSQVFYRLHQDDIPFAYEFIGERSTVVGGLTPETTYTFAISVRDWFGNTNVSNIVTVTTPPADDMVPPTAPTNFQASDRGCPEARLSWTASTDNVDQSLIVYQIFINGVHTFSVLGTSAWVTVDEVPGPNTFFVRAVDTSGNVSPPSNEVTLPHIC